jgi:DNA-binding YbaB/EbfC family protein
MFKELGQMAALFKQLPQIAKLKEEADRLQQRVAQLSADGDAGAGMVKVRVNGRQEVVSCIISEDAFRSGDREILGEMIRGAVNQALERVRQLVAEETQKMATNMGLPLGMGLAGMTEPGS